MWLVSHQFPDNSQAPVAVVLGADLVVPLSKGHLVQVDDLDVVQLLPDHAVDVHVIQPQEGRGLGRLGMAGCGGYNVVMLSFGRVVG